MMILYTFFIREDHPSGEEKPLETFRPPPLVEECIKKICILSLLSKIEISPQSRRGRREVIFLFGGLPARNRFGEGR